MKSVICKSRMRQVDMSGHCCNVSNKESGRGNLRNEARLEYMYRSRWVKESSSNAEPDEKEQVYVCVQESGKPPCGNCLRSRCQEELSGQMWTVRNEEEQHVRHWVENTYKFSHRHRREVKGLSYVQVDLRADS